MSERNKAHIRRLIEEVYNKGDLDAVAEVASPDLVIHSASGEIRGHAGAREYVAALRAGFPNLAITVEDQVAEGDMVATRWVARGTHRGAFQGVPATGRDVVMTGTDIDRIAGGKVAECWAQVDVLGLMRQLGAA
ncbi:MAG TPA: ester cyclase [Acetobacteraceae bacterium]|nr:ester cyclase [Acetobacteraceae bacterium]